ncbi:hypothetical protein ACW2QC_11230 [Virgibacillus sp. FSP13]
MRAETSARERKHRPESGNIGPRAETSAREQKHRRESGNIGASPCIKAKRFFCNGSPIFNSIYVTFLINYEIKKQQIL